MRVVRECDAFQELLEEQTEKRYDVILLKKPETQ